MVRLFPKSALRRFSTRRQEQNNKQKKHQSSTYTKCVGSSTSSLSLSMAEKILPAESKKGKISFLFLSNVRRQAKTKAEEYPFPEIDFDALPIIDKIPTAIGYQSSGSEEETLGDKSRSSRYSSCEDDEKSVVSDESDVEEDDRDDYDYISETDDRYSIFDDLDLFSFDLSSTDDESITDFEVKIGNELHRQRERLRAKLIRLTKSADQADTSDDSNPFPRLNICFGETNMKARTWSSPGSCNDDES